MSALPTPRVVARALLLATLTVAPPPATQDSAPQQRPSPTQPAPRPAADTRDDPRAVRLLEDLGGELFHDSFLLSGRLRTERPDAVRETILRVRHLAPDRTLVRAVGNDRHRGTSFLLHPGGLAAWFPRAELLLELPAGSAGQRLFGSDLSLEDLGLLMGRRERFHLAWLGAREVDGAPASGASLVPRAPGLSLYARVELWARNVDGAPLRMTAFDAHGAVLRELRFTEHEAGAAQLWIAEDPRAGTRTELRVGRVERDPRFDPARFELDGLSTWR